MSANAQFRPDQVAAMKAQLRQSRKTGAKVEGMKELIAAFNGLGAYSTLEEISYKGTYGSAKDLRELLRDQIRVTFREGKGALARGPAIKKIIEGSKRGYTVSIRSGGRRRKAENNPFYWWFHEFGYYNKPPKHFFTKAIQIWQGSAMPTVERQAGVAIMKAALRYARQRAR